MVRFVNPDNPKSKWEMPPGFIGEVPGWVEKHWYFDALCKDGTITAIKSKSDRDIQAAVDEKAAEEQRRLAEEQRRLAEEQQKSAEPAGEQDDADSGEAGGDDTTKTVSKKGNGGKK